MYAITGIDGTGKDKLFSFASGVTTDLTDFSSGTQGDGGATVRQAVWVGNCTGDASSIYLVAQSGAVASPTINATNACAKIGDGDDRIIHVRKGCKLWAVTDSGGTAKVRVVELS